MDGREIGFNGCQEYLQSRALKQILEPISFTFQNTSVVAYETHIDFES